MNAQPTLDLLPLEAARHQMVSQQLRTWEVLDGRVLDALNAIKRELFVPKAFRNVAFADTQIPLGHGQFMLQPKVDGKILQALGIQPADDVLDVGTGSGFLAACMAKLGGKVRSVELFSDLIEQSRANIHAAAVNNVSVEKFDAVELSDEGRYDAIAVTASIARDNEALEQRFKRALKVGGRLFLVTGSAPVMEAVKYTRTTQSHWGREELFETVIEPLIHAPQPKAFVF